MKTVCTLALAAVLTACCLTGCFGRKPTETTVPTTTAPVPTTRATTPVVPDTTMPSMDEMIPGPEDTVDPTSGKEDGMVDPTNGANQDETTRKRHSPRF